MNQNLKNHYISEKLFYSIKKGIKTNCFFILPSFIMTNYKQNTWMSETKYISFGFLKFYMQINITKINKTIDYKITQDLIEKINYILTLHDYFISDNEKLNEYLEKNKNIIILLKNCYSGHKYLQNTFLNIIKYNDFIKKR